MKRSRIIRYVLLVLLLLTVWVTQHTPAMGEGYARLVYPVIALCLSSCSRFVPFSFGDLFITLSVTGVILYPIYGRYKRVRWGNILLRDVEYLLWVYVWFYLAWGLNYSQKNFYQRTGTEYVKYSPETFKEFTKEYVQILNEAYVSVDSIDKTMAAKEISLGYNRAYDSLGVNRPFTSAPKVKAMMFSWASSAVGITGYMGPFFCEFNLNKNLLPVDYPSTYAHELAHFWGITGEAEANFYAYQICTRSTNAKVRFSGYFSVFNHVMRNAKGLLAEADYKELVDLVRPEIKELAEKNYKHWMAMYNPLIGNVQDWIYDLYLKGNKIESGRKNYSEVVGLLISWNEKTKIENLRRIIIKNNYAH